MTQMASVRYTFRDGWRLVIRHWGMSLLTIFTAMTVFFIIGASTLFVMNIKNIVSIMENQLSIHAYLRPSADIQSVADKILAMPGVTEAKVITKEMALERLRARIGSQAKAIALVGENPLPASIEVRVKKAADVANTARMLLAVPEVEDTIYAGHIAEKLAKVSWFIEKFSMAMLLIAIAASSVVLFNTIRISVYSREYEIGVMLKVGATTLYIMMPFVIQGFILGLTGSCIASGILALVYDSAIIRLKDLLPFLAFIEQGALMPKLFLMLISCGTAISLVSSLLAVEGFIRKMSRPI